MNYQNTAEQVLAAVGGKSNVAANMTCMTRLRISISDHGKVDTPALKKIDGVLGVVDSDTVQIVFGPGTVNKVGMEFSKLTGLALGSDEASGEMKDVREVAKENKAANKAKYNGPVQRFLKHIANVFIPILPGIIAAGLINGIINVINVSTNNAMATVWWYQVIHVIGWALFLYLPIFVGMNAAKEFKGSAILGALAGAYFVAHPLMPLLAKAKDGSQILLPLTDKVFNPGNGGLISALIAGILFAFLER